MLTAALSSPSNSRPILTADDNFRASTHLDSQASRTATTDPSDNNSPPPHIRIVPHLDSPRSLVFSIIERDVRNDTVLKIGRFTDRFMSPNRITFRSKVVSRGHAEIWTEGSKFYIRDTRSSSGTFLNHVRLSAPNQDSRPFLLKDGDVVQLGVDYQGGTEEIYRAVKMRIELNRSWQNQANTFSLNTFQSLRNLTTPPNNVSVLDAAMGDSSSAAHGNLPSAARQSSKPDEDQNIHIEDCCICLYAIAPFQALFVAPCSHTFHFKCCRPLLQSYPGFLCPLCRSYADLDASVAIEANEVLQMLRQKQQQEVNENDTAIKQETDVPTKMEDTTDSSHPQTQDDTHAVAEATPSSS
ncbi:hypothetical protein BCR43DRAFT_276597 [Syncephalastrum racemosum]|uniref:SMAD/FHA domain-containing protein n=1 Tax=Syncephalastrum racemosum TaxID=13706 RepID=A0A1X2HDP2_SYNRA|nr:hypothetical protein BCR43DRAFT_276597 [Syncephalastrum racemosum]